jgi:hypothetical protein
VFQIRHRHVFVSVIIIIIVVVVVIITTVVIIQLIVRNCHNHCLLSAISN